MNKRFSTLLAGVALLSAVSANAVDLDKSKFYHLQTQAVGASSGKALNLTLTKNYLGTKADSIVAVVATEAAAMTDSALWKAAYVMDEVTGKYTWTITNKAVPTAQLSFAAGSNMMGDATDNKINDADAAAFGLKKLSSLNGSLKFAWETPTKVTAGNELVSSYIQSKDSTMLLAVNIAATEAFTANKKFALIQVMGKGNTPALAAGAVAKANPIVALKAVLPDKRLLSVKELNSKMPTNGFQLFFFHKNTLTAQNNALTNVVFEAEDANGSDETATDVMLKAKLIAPKKDKSGDPQYSYAYLDTISYSAANNLPTDGSRMTFRVDTLPREDGSAATILADNAYTFNFIFDPAVAKDSVAVFVKASYDPSTPGTDPRTYDDKAATDEDHLFPLQIDALGGTSSDKLILTTGAELEVLPLASATATPIVSTRISFTGGTPIETPLKKDKVYSIKYVMADESAKDKNGKYVIADLAGDGAYSNNVFTHVPATQYVFDGAQLVNREFDDIYTSALYTVDASKNLYTNMTDTMEIVAMDVDVKDATIGYSNISKDSLTNYAFTFDYISGILEGRSIDMKKDSSVAALLDNAKAFKLDEVAPLAVIENSANNEVVAQLKNKAYKIYSKDKATIMYIGEDNKLHITNVKSAIASEAALAEADKFYLKETANVGEYILMNLDRNVKFNVNSTTELLEVALPTVDNNAFAIQTEMAPTYVLDAAKKHMSFVNPRGDKLAADSKKFAVFRKEGELKANYEADNFKLWIDSANTTSKTQPSYFILSGAKCEKDSPVLEGNFLRVMSDSTDVEGYKAANGAIRLAFVPAKRIATSDSLLVNYTNEKLTKADSVGFKGKNDAADKIGQFQFKIQYTDVEGEYLLHDANGNYLATYNDVLCLAANVQGAQLVKLASTDAPVGNESIEAATIKVVAGEGNVTVYGAAGKKVTVSDVLGKATTVIATSDSQVIPVAQGVAIIAVEGGATAKAIIR